MVGCNKRRAEQGVFAPLFLEGMTQSLGYLDRFFQQELCACVKGAINSLMRALINFYFAYYVTKPTATAQFFSWGMA